MPLAFFLFDAGDEVHFSVAAAAALPGQLVAPGNAAASSDQGFLFFIFKLCLQSQTRLSRVCQGGRGIREEEEVIR